VLLCFAALSTGCAGSSQRLPPLVEIRVERIEVPDALLTCAPSPDVPLATRQRDVAAYIAELWEAGQDCRDKLAAVRAIVRPE
jgi:hypothetical protein